jgi:hypothetical protein
MRPIPALSASSPQVLRVNVERPAIFLPLFTDFFSMTGFAVVRHRSNRILPLTDS